MKSILQRVESSPVLFHLLNLLVASIWGYYLYRSFHYFQSVNVAPPEGASDDDLLMMRLYQLTGLILVANNALLILFFLLRRRATDVAGDPASLLLGHLGTWLPVLPMIWPESTTLSPKLVIPCTAIMVAGLAVSTLGFVSLGRSWGIIPANRGVRDKGLYRFVRHPIYANYMVFYANYALVHWSVVTAIVAAGMPILLSLRAILEERVLMKDPAYAAYAQRVRYRFFPGLI